MKCVVCGKEFESRRRSAKYCSNKCRVQAQRKVTGTERDLTSTNDVPVKVSGTEVSVPVVTDADQVKDAIHILSGRGKNRDRDDFFSPDYDLSEAGLSAATRTG